MRSTWPMVLVSPWPQTVTCEQMRINSISSFNSFFFFLTRMLITTLSSFFFPNSLQGIHSKILLLEPFKLCSSVQLGPCMLYKQNFFISQIETVPFKKYWPHFPMNLDSSYAAITVYLCECDYFRYSLYPESFLCFCVWAILLSIVFSRLNTCCSIC